MTVTATRPAAPERPAGRQVTCDLIDRSFETPGPPLLIGGPPGIGRTTVLRHARRVAAALGLRVHRDGPDGGSAPVAVVLDDVPVTPGPWLDRLTAATPPGSVIVLACPGTPDPADWAGRAEVHVLPPLDLTSALAVLESCPGRLSGRERREITDLAEGNPRALVALHAAVRQGASRADGSRIPDGRRIHAGLADRLRPLGPPARRLLEIAALALPDESAAVVRTAAGPDARAWPELVQAGLVTARDGRIVFPDPLVRVAARHPVPLAARHDAATRLGLASATDPDRGAWYRSVAELGDHPSRISDLERAARAAGPRLPVDPVRCWESAARLAPDPAGALLAAAVAALGAADPDRVAGLCRRLARSTDDPGRLAAGAAVTAVALSRCGATDAARTVLAAAEQYRPRLSAEVSGLLDAVAGRITGTPTDPARPADPADPVAVLTEALAGDPVDDDDLPRPVSPRIRQARAHGTLGRYAEAATDHVEHLVDAARWDEALDLIDALDAHAALGRWTAIQVDMAALRATVRALRGEPGPPSLGRIWQAVDLTENPAAQVRLDRAAGLTAMVAGDWAGAYRHLRALFTATGEPVHGELSVRALADLATAAVRCGRRDEAAVVVDTVRAGAGPSTRIRLLLHRAVALTGDTDTERHHRLAVVDPAGEQWPLDRALGRLHYGQWLRRHRRPSDARVVVEAALATFERLGAAAYAETARTELRAAGRVPAADRGPGPLARLTPQERQVVVLAAAGLPNRAIAEQLLISARTVGCHLYKAYPKLGVTGRHQLAALVPPS